MKTILEKAKKWFASVHSEVPAFCKLCKVTIFLITKTIKKKDTSVDKSAFAELRTKTPNAQIAFGGIVVAILLVLLMRGCGDPRKDALKLVAELQEHENQRQIEIANKQEAEQKAYEEKQSARDKAIAALETSHAEIGQKWKEREAAAFAKIDDELGTLSKRILSDKVFVYVFDRAEESLFLVFEGRLAYARYALVRVYLDEHPVRSETIDGEGLYVGDFHFCFTSPFSFFDKTMIYHFSLYICQNYVFFYIFPLKA